MLLLLLSLPPPRWFAVYSVLGFGGLVAGAEGSVSGFTQQMRDLCVTEAVSESTEGYPSYKSQTALTQQMSNLCDTE